MNIRIALPIALLLAPVLCIWIGFRGRKQPKPIIVLRLLTVLLTVLALAGVSISRKSEMFSVLFAVDTSDSMQQKGAALEFIQAAIDAAPSDAKGFVGVVSFDSQARLELNLTDINAFELKEALTESSGSNFSNLEGGLRISSAVMDDMARKKIVLLSDGMENRGDALGYARILREQGVVVDTVSIEAPQFNEVQLTKLETPDYVHSGAPFDIQVTIDALQESTINLRIYKNNGLFWEQTINATQGENHYTLPDSADTGGYITYRAEISAELDTFYQNNTGFSYSYVSDMPHILILDDENSGEAFEQILAENHVIRMNASAAPGDLNSLLGYEGIIIANVPYEQFSESFITSLQQYVSHNGGGLLVSGGENAFAPGGYLDTPLEEMLPVWMRLKDDEYHPGLAMVMVIDRSGSMSENVYGVSRMSLAKEAAIRSVQTLEKEDAVGVIAFDDMPSWAVELNKIEGNTNRIIEAIGSINEGGGTSILPALSEAFEKLSGYNAPQKHIILLTDGQAERTGYEDLINKMKEAGITLSTVAVGTGADTELLSTLAKQSNGRYYYTNEFTDLPRIFAKETMLAGKKYINHEPFRPVVTSRSPIIDGIERMPELNGYIATLEKPSSTVLLSSDLEDPILASWQYGLGRVLVWTSDMGQGFSEDFLKTNEGLQLAGNMVSWILKNNENSNISVEGEQIGSTVLLQIKMPYHSGITEVTATMLTPDLKTDTLQLSQIAPGHYEGEVPYAGSGLYMVSSTVHEVGGMQQTSLKGFSLAATPEYDVRHYLAEQSVLEAVAGVTGGVYNPDADTIFKQFGTQADTINMKNRDISDKLLIAALICFLIELTLRRFTLTMPGIRHGRKQKPDGAEQKNSTAKPIEEKKKTSSILLDKKKKRIGG